VSSGRRILRRALKRADLPRRPQWLNDPVVIKLMTQCQPLSAVTGKKSSNYRCPNMPEEIPLATKMRQVWYQGGPWTDADVVNIVPPPRRDSPEGQ
jgi:hypothetical protein